MKQEIADLRKDYRLQTLNEEDVAGNAIDQFTTLVERSNRQQNRRSKCYDTRHHRARWHAIGTHCITKRL